MPEQDAINQYVAAARDSNMLFVVESQRHHYVYPKFSGNYVRVLPDRVRWEWQREVVAGGNMLIRHEIALSTRANREFEMQQLLEMQKAGNSNPLKLEPNFMGLGIDLKKAYAWLRARFADKR